MFGITCGGFIFLDHYYRKDYNHLSKTEAFLTDAEFDPSVLIMIVITCHYYYY